MTMLTVNETGHKLTENTHSLLMEQATRSVILKILTVNETGHSFADTENAH